MQRRGDHMARKRAVPNAADARRVRIGADSLHVDLAAPEAQNRPCVRPTGKLRFEAAIPLFSPIVLEFSPDFPPIGRTKVEKSLQTVSTHVRRWPRLNRRKASPGRTCPDMSGQGL